MVIGLSSRLSVWNLTDTFHISQVDVKADQRVLNYTSLLTAGKSTILLRKNRPFWRVSMGDRRNERFDAVPFLSQIKSFVQYASGDSESALRTQENFSKRCPFVSQVRSAVESFSGDNEAAANTGREFLGIDEYGSERMDTVPVISQIKSLVQYASGDSNSALRTQENFSRKCIFVSQVRSAIESISGDNEAAMNTQRQFLGLDDAGSERLDSVPVISQIKSLVQCKSGDLESALMTQENFSRKCIIVSQLRSAVESICGDNEAALNTQRKFLGLSPARINLSSSTLADAYASERCFDDTVGKGEGLLETEQPLESEDISSCAFILNEARADARDDGNTMMSSAERLNENFDLTTSRSNITSSSCTNSDESKRGDSVEIFQKNQFKRSDQDSFTSIQDSEQVHSETADHRSSFGSGFIEDILNDEVDDFDDVESVESSEGAQTNFRSSNDFNPAAAGHIEQEVSLESLRLLEHSNIDPSPTSSSGSKKDNTYIIDEDAVSSEDTVAFPAAINLVFIKASNDCDKSNHSEANDEDVGSDEGFVLV